MSEWQPIETAPKNVPYAILLAIPLGVAEGGWNPEWGRWALSGWTKEEADAVNLQPTHWMPLPEPPK